MNSDIEKRLKDRIEVLEKNIPHLLKSVQKNRGKYHKKRPPDDVVEEYHELSAKQKELKECKEDLKKVAEAGDRRLYDTCVISGKRKRVNKNQVSKECLKDMYKDIMEIVYDGGRRVFKKDQVEEATEFLKSLGRVDVVFDMHNVLDTIDANGELFADEYNVRSVCCSFVGAGSYGMRTRTLADIEKRIVSGQIKWGALVFKRDRNNHKYHAPGSKAWFCNVIGAKYFLDDGLDHIESVRSMTPLIGCLHIKKPYEENVDKALNRLDSVLKSSKDVRDKETGDGN